MITMDSISKRYPGSGTYAVKNISLTVKKGEVIGLLGENGAGKTTILLILSTLIKPSSGSASVMDCDIAENPAMVRTHIGTLFSNQRLYERLTGRENILYFAELHGCNQDHINRKIREFSEHFQMSEYIDKRVSTYSQGMKQKISLSRMLVHDPQVLLLDEPAAGLDLSSLYVFLEFIMKRKDQKAVIFSSHNLNDVSKVSDRIVILHKGKLVDQGNIRDLRRRYNCDLEDLYLRIIQESS